MVVAQAVRWCEEGRRDGSAGCGCRRCIFLLAGAGGFRSAVAMDSLADQKFGLERNVAEDESHADTIPVVRIGEVTHDTY